MPAPPLVEPPGLQAGRWPRGSRACGGRGGGEHQARGAGVDDDRHPVVLAELLDEHPQRLLDQRQLVGLVHRARDVDQEDEVARRPLVVGDGTALQADAGEPVLGVPGAAGHLDVDRERVVAGRGRVVVGEVVDQLLDPDGVLRRPRVLVEEAPDVGVGGGVDVDREGRQRGGPHAEERVLDDPVEGLGVGRARRPAPRRPEPSSLKNCVGTTLGELLIVLSRLTGLPPSSRRADPPAELAGLRLPFPALASDCGCPCCLPSGLALLRWPTLGLRCPCCWPFRPTAVAASLGLSLHPADSSCSTARDALRLISTELRRGPSRLSLRFMLVWDSSHLRDQSRNRPAWPRGAESQRAGERPGGA